MLNLVIGFIFGWITSTAMIVIMAVKAAARRNRLGSINRGSNQNAA